MGAPWLNLGQILRVNAKKYPDHVAFFDAQRSYTFPESNLRINRLAHALLDMGLAKGDKVSCLLENCIEICELYIACAKTGIVINPINFRLIGSEVQYIADNADSKAFFVHKEFLPVVDPVRWQLPKVEHYVCVGGEAQDCVEYESLLERHPEAEPEIDVAPEDTWVLLYTSGTTGKPKGVVRSHESYTAFYLINGVDFGFTEHDVCLNVMPLCHVNSTFFSFNFTYVGGSVYVHPAHGFDPAELLRVIEKSKATFISLIPTHYNLILNVPAEEAAKYDVSSITKLLCSSAPGPKELKLGIMEFFKGVELYEGYGSTEAGIVTTLKPHEQLTKLGSIGKESCGTDFVKILDENGEPVPVGEVGELYSRGPMLFDGYYKLPEKTAESFSSTRDGWFTARDMAREDEDGYFYIVDRKDNMVITGGEHVYPSEVEAVISTHPAVLDVAVIGIQDPKWGEAVKAVVILKEGASCSGKKIIDFCRGKITAYKKPKSVDFIEADEMPRTGTGKILHRKLRERYT
jgi:acyl-CoA synthetase (AMP-forming)/AMP-acid ligase II